MSYDKETTLRIIDSIQPVVKQMIVDDIENSPDAATEQFQCPCCGAVKALAGSMTYDSYLFCNDCVLMTEISLALNKIKDPSEMIEKMSDKRFENLYTSIFEQDPENDQE
ncbi:MAG: hypothetical protein AB7V50_01125 [Vampirovibrionia bacterium]